MTLLGAAFMLVACGPEADPPVELLPADHEPDFDGISPTTPDDGCDGIDNDVDGAVDEGCYCTVGETRTCYAGPVHTLDVGRCSAGLQRCLSNDLGVGVWSHCAGAVLPEVEVCGNDADEDCDGLAPSCDDTHDVRDIGAH